MGTKKGVLGSPGSRDAEEFLNELRGRPMSLGDYLAAVRAREEQSLAAFAERLGISRGNLCDIEKGRRSVSLERAAAWSKELGLPPAALVELALQQAVWAAGLDLRVKVEGKRGRAA